MSYKANPIDTSDIVLDPSLMELTEQLAKNTHEVWSDLRQKEGWVYGKVRDDKKKEHPDLIPYEKLTEAEKDIDREAAIETLKLIEKLGFKIKKNESTSSSRFL